MKFWSLLIWVTQFGFSAVFPMCFFLVLANWLRQRYNLGIWILILFAVLGALTTVSTVRSCIRTMRKETEDGCETPPVSYNDHD